MLLALGGNAIIPAGGAGTIDEQISITEKSLRSLVVGLDESHEVLITHGNGPVVGNILIRNECAASEVPSMPLDVCGADSQGGMGYMIQQALRNELRRAGLQRHVVTVVTQVRVEADDPAFGAPTKPIGPFYTKERAEHLRAASGWQWTEDAGRGYRRVVPSPHPRELIEATTIGNLLDAGVLVIAGGGGGIPVVRDEDGILSGVEAVIDKDHASAMMARELHCELFVNVTGVDRVAIGFGTDAQRDLEVLQLDDAKRYLAAGEFPAGSMGPKIQAAIDFIEGGGGEVLITSPAVLGEALEGRSGTRIVARADRAAATA